MKITDVSVTMINWQRAPWRTGSGAFGGHRFYNGRTGSAVAQLLLTIIGLLLTVVVVGFLFLLVVAIWALVDAFLIPEWVRKHNFLLAEKLGSA